MRISKHEPIYSKGYRYVYYPKSESASKSSSYNGYVLEHRLVVEKSIGRRLNNDEDVHHLDLNKLNNEISNLIVVSDKEHTILHHLIKEGRYSIEELMSREKVFSIIEMEKKRIDSEIALAKKRYIEEHKNISIPNGIKTKNFRMGFCCECGSAIWKLGKGNLCLKCSSKRKRKCERPTKEQLEYDVHHFPYLDLEKKYGVSTAAIKKWMVSLGIEIPVRREHWITNKPRVMTEKRKNGIEKSKLKISEFWSTHKHPSSKMVEQLDAEGNVVAVYDSVAEASRSNDGFNESPIARVCRGVLPHYKGYRWRYVK